MGVMAEWAGVGDRPMPVGIERWSIEVTPLPGRSIYADTPGWKWVDVDRLVRDIVPLVQAGTTSRWLRLEVVLNWGDRELSSMILSTSKLREGLIAGLEEVGISAILSLRLKAVLSLQA